MYIVGIILSIAYIVIYWYDLFRDSLLNDLLEIITMSVYTLLAVRNEMGLNCRLCNVCTFRRFDITYIIFHPLVWNLWVCNE